MLLLSQIRDTRVKETVAGLTIRWRKEDRGVPRKQYSPRVPGVRCMSLLKSPCGSYWSTGPVWLPVMYGSAWVWCWAHTLVATEHIFSSWNWWEDRLMSVRLKWFISTEWLVFQRVLPFTRASMIVGRTIPTRFPETHPFSQDNTMPENTTYIAAWCRAAAAAKRQIEKVTGREWSSWTDSSTRGIELLPSVYSDVIYSAAWFTSPSHKLS